METRASVHRGSPALSSRSPGRHSVLPEGRALNQPDILRLSDPFSQISCPITSSISASSSALGCPSGRKQDPTEIAYYYGSCCFQWLLPIKTGLDAQTQYFFQICSLIPLSPLSGKYQVHEFKLTSCQFTIQVHRISAWRIGNKPKPHLPMNL